MSRHHTNTSAIYSLWLSFAQSDIILLGRKIEKKKKLDVFCKQDGLQEAWCQHGVTQCHDYSMCNRAPVLPSTRFKQSHLKRPR